MSSAGRKSLAAWSASGFARDKAAFTARFAPCETARWERIGGDSLRLGAKVGGKWRYPLALTAAKMLYYAPVRPERRGRDL